MGLCASGSNKVYIDGYTPYEYYQDEWREQLKACPIKSECPVKAQDGHTILVTSD